MNLNVWTRSITEGDKKPVIVFFHGGGGKVNNLMRMPSAKGTFHKAAALSSSYGLITKELNDKIVKGTLEKLGLKDVSELETYDYYNMMNAAQSVCSELGTNWTPEADGVIIQEKLCSWADEIPFIGSTVFSEFNYNWRFAGPGKNTWTDDEAMKNLTEKYGDKAEGIAEEFKKVFPGRKLADAYFYYGAAPVSSTIYYICRRGLEETVLAEKTATAKAPVFEYLFDYEVPVNGGVLSFHCSDLIYIFHNVDIPVVSIATAGDDDAHKMQDVTADAFLAFMRTGNPSTEKLEWKPYTPADKNIMIFSRESKCRILGDEKLYTLMDEAVNKK